VKSVWEVTPYYTRCFEKRPFFVRGKKPAELAAFARVTARQWQMYQTHLKRENPILIGLRYLKAFEQESVTSYAKAAQVLGVSRIRVYQLTSLVTKLPAEITDFLLACEEPTVLRFFTERRLRPLTKIADREQQKARFAGLLGEAKGGTPGSGDTLWSAPERDTRVPRRDSEN
jgi:hypothetical protein